MNYQPDLPQPDLPSTLDSLWEEVKSLGVWENKSKFSVWVSLQKRRLTENHELSLIRILPTSGPGSFRLIPLELRNLLQGSCQLLQHNGNWQGLFDMGGCLHLTEPFPSRKQAHTDCFRQKIEHFKANYRSVVGCRLFLYCLETLEHQKRHGLS